MNRMLLAAGLLAAPLLLAGCKLTARLPFYVESNEPRPKGDQAYDVRREQPYPRSLVNRTLKERGRFGRSVDYVTNLASVSRVPGLAKGMSPDEVAAANRGKIERAIGRPIVRKRDELNPIHADPYPDVDVILALSGGGMRAANLGSAVMFEMSKVTLERRGGTRITLLDAVDTISSVSGGGFAATFYLFHRGVFRNNEDAQRADRHQDLIQVAMRENIQRRLVANLIYPTKLSFFIRASTRATRTNLYSNLIEYRLVRPQRIESLEASLYPKWWRKRKVISAVTSFMEDILWRVSPVTPDDQYLFGAKGRTFDDLYLRDPDDPQILYPLRPEWIANATAYNPPVSDNKFLFDQAAFNRLGSDWMNYRVSDAAAASAAFPVVFTPMTLRDWSTSKPTWKFLFDGGVSDNQGMNGVREALNEHPTRRHVVIMVDASPRSGAIVADSPDRPGGIALTNRALERYMDSVRGDTLKALEERQREGNLRFFHLSIRPGEFGSKLPEDAEAAFEGANHVPTALSISRDDQERLFEVGRLLVARDREAMAAAITAPAAANLPSPAGAAPPPGAPAGGAPPAP